MSHYAITNPKSRKTESPPLVFLITISLTKNKVACKRKILCHISQIFDPLGLLGPVTVQAKVILQKLW